MGKTHKKGKALAFSNLSSFIYLIQMKRLELLDGVNGTGSGKKP